MSENAGLTSDMGLSEAVEQALLVDATTRDHPLSVAAQGGLITLAGRVPDQAVKEAAIRVPRGVAGVADVIDEVTVGTDERPGLFGRGGRVRDGSGRHGARAGVGSAAGRRCGGRPGRAAAAVRGRAGALPRRALPSWPPMASARTTARRRRAHGATTIRR